MKLALLFLLLAGSPLLGSRDGTPPEGPRAEYAERRQAAGDDVDKLWELVEFCEEHDLEDEGAEVLKAIVAADPSAARAYQALGYERQDLAWIPPDEVENIAKQLYKCGDAWLPVEKANAHHAKLATWWRIPSQEGHFRLYATTDRWVAEEALSWMEVVFHDLVRLYGRAPSEPSTVVLLRNLGQYNDFATGGQMQNNIGTEASGFSSQHGAYVVETWYDPTYQEFPRAGVAFWDISTWADHAWGKMYLRHAAGLAFAEGLDPSKQAERAMLRSMSTQSQFDPSQFWTEKKIPMWIRYGGASYAERFFYDATALNEDEDPYRLRKWTIDEAIEQVQPLDLVFDFDLPSSDPKASQRLMAQAGLLVAFVLDGQCKPVELAHGAFKSALRQGEGVPEAVHALQQAIVQHEPELFAFADLPPRPADDSKAAEAAAQSDTDGEKPAPDAESGKKPETDTAKKSDTEADRNPEAPENGGGERDGNGARAPASPDEAVTAGAR